MHDASDFRNAAVLPQYAPELFNNDKSISRTTFDPANILPCDRYPHTLKKPKSVSDLAARGRKLQAWLMFGAPRGPAAEASRGDGSVSPPSVFDPAEENEGEEHETPPTTALGSGSDDPTSYDLKPPPPSVSHENIEALSERFFSADHLDLILRDQTFTARFTKFLNEYRPRFTETLKRHVDAKKAIAAVAYANAVAEHLQPTEGHRPVVAATLDDEFERASREAVEDLVEEALPAYVTHRLVTLVTDTLVKEITGTSAPIMRELVPSLAEVYCVTDPSLPDNPIVYASEAFYNTTQYHASYVIGRNCRFLQGPKTAHSTVQRMISALTEGEEICETILNYRRDGSPFMNLLLLAPLYDNKGIVRYFLGAQIDVSSLIEGGRGLESFSQLLSQDRNASRMGSQSESGRSAKLGELGQLLDADEAAIITNRTRSHSAASDRDRRPLTRPGRVKYGMEDTSDKQIWPHPSLGHSGRLPGVYQNYLLVRPHPSLRITFTSPALRIPGLLQTKFLDRIGGEAKVREGISDALQHGTPVTAKVMWLTSPKPSGSGESVHSDASKHQPVPTQSGGKPRWIHCTPLLGSDDRVGVWMIVMVEQEEVTGRLNNSARQRYEAIRDDDDGGGGRGILASPLRSPSGAASPRFNGNKLYAEYLKREGSSSMQREPQRPSTKETSDSVKEQREVDGQFRDF